MLDKKKKLVLLLNWYELSREKLHEPLRKARNLRDCREREKHREDNELK
jgi:hypothetical protein